MKTSWWDGSVCPLLKSNKLQYNTLLLQDKWLVDQASDVPSVWCSKHYFFIDLGHSKLFIFIFDNLWKNKRINWNDFCKESCKKLWKKLILWLSDAWSTSHLSQQASEPVYNIVDCQISSPLLTVVWMAYGIYRQMLFFPPAFAYKIK